MKTVRVRSGQELTADRRTRDRIVELLITRGPSTAATLGDALGLTAAAVRRHLDTMVASGAVVEHEDRRRGPRGRGRPARTFALTDAGHRAGPTSYDAVAVDALRYLRETAGEEAVEDFARRRIEAWEERYSPAMAELPLDQRPVALAEALSADGYAATVHENVHAPVASVQVCQHHCPVQHVAQEFPALCEAETQAIGRLVGRPVQRLATIARGDGVCTTHIPLAAVPAPTSSSGRTPA